MMAETEWLTAESQGIGSGWAENDDFTFLRLGLRLGLRLELVLRFGLNWGGGVGDWFGMVLGPAGWIGLLARSFRIYRRPMVSEICQMDALRKGTTQVLPTTIAGDRFVTLNRHLLVLLHAATCTRSSCFSWWLANAASKLLLLLLLSLPLLPSPSLLIQTALQGNFYWEATIISIQYFPMAWFFFLHSSSSSSSCVLLRVAQH